MFYDRHQFDNQTRLEKFTRDISGIKFYQFLDKYFIYIQIALGIVFYFLGGISWVVWGIFVRLVLVYHATWCVNSVCHKWGTSRTGNLEDQSKNNWIIAILTFGEGWHSNHHHEPRSAKHGRGYQLDLTYCLIYCLHQLKLISNLKYY